MNFFSLATPQSCTKLHKQLQKKYSRLYSDGAKQHKLFLACTVNKIGYIGPIFMNYTAPIYAILATNDRDMRSFDGKHYTAQNLAEWLREI